MATRIIFFHRSTNSQKIVSALTGLGFFLLPILTSQADKISEQHDSSRAIYFFHDEQRESSEVGIRQLVNRFPKSRIISISKDFSTRDRINTYLAGADICFPDEVCIEELAACLQSWDFGEMRNKKENANNSVNISSESGDVPIGHSHTTPSKIWRIKNSDGSLIAPSMVVIQLATRERDLIEKFASTEGQFVSRDDINEISTAHKVNPRVLDVMISRLKKKAEIAGIILPIKSVRGRGYFFSEKLQLDNGSLSNY